MARQTTMADRLVRDLGRQQGVTVVKSASGHWKVYRAGRLITVVAGTPGYGRAWQNTMAVLRREGLLPAA